MDAETDCASNLWEPGWLMRVSHEAHISCMADHSPYFFGNRVTATSLPIPENEAQEVFERMDKRFKAWTGKSLAEHVGALLITSHKRGEG